MEKKYLRLSECVPETDGVTIEETTGGSIIRTSERGGKISLQGEQGKVGGLDWKEAEYVVMDVKHSCHDVLVIVMEFYIRDGKELNDRIEVHFGVLPGVPTRLCLPLSSLNSEKLFLPRFPGTMQMVLRGGAGIRKEDIRYFSVGTPESVVPREFLLTDVHLAGTLPVFPTPQIPLVDELGQFACKEWAGKTNNATELSAYLQDEEREQEVTPFYGVDGLWSRYGGWKLLRFDATGFFRTQFDGQRWWLVDPDGYAFLSTGLDCMMPGETMKVDGMEHLISWLPEKDGEFRDAWKKNDGRPGDYFSYAIANLIRAFGEHWWTSWASITRRRMREWGFNTVANWSEPEFIRYARMPYVWPLSGFPSTNRLIFRDFPDVFSEEYRLEAVRFASQLEKFIGDPLLIGYFLRNEPNWAFVDGLNITEKMLEHPEELVSKFRFIEFIRDRYDNSIAAWNQAWKLEFTCFEQLLQPIMQAASLSEQAARDLEEFNRLMIEAYVSIPATECRKVDSEHLNLGMRYAWISSELLLAGSGHFDVFSINTYQMKPDAEVIRRISETTGLPVMIGEFHHGAADVGMLSNGIRGVPTQEDRGLAYRYFVEGGAAMPELIGMHYFILNDQALLGRFDGENYQIGAVDVCHRPYQPFISGILEAHARMYDVATSKDRPYSIIPPEIPRTGF